MHRPCLVVRVVCLCCDPCPCPCPCPFLFLWGWQSTFVHHDSVEGAMGVKISAPDLGNAVVGTSVLVLHPEDELEDLKECVMVDFETAMQAFEKQPRGVAVQASTLGAWPSLWTLMGEPGAAYHLPFRGRFAGVPRAFRGR